ncbi:MAG TPA: ABC transporter substrate-binding protein [Solirubrobacteraceae bacterium]|nr:ABC transporter substrate-binding protein [Solirubrobacteraceae bacterium]
MKSRRTALRGLGTVAAVAAGSLAIAACGSSTSSVKNTTQASLGTSLYGTLPTAGTPSTAGGTINLGQISGQTPTYIFPVTPGAFTNTQNGQLISDLFLPVYNGPNGAKPEDNTQISLADPPVESNGGKTYTITVRPGFKWSDGKPVDANDIVFGFDLLNAAVKESPANWGQYVPGEFPQSVTSIKAIGTNKVQINLNKAYNPGFFLYNQLQDTNYGLFALPSTAWNIDALGGPHLDYTNPANAKKIYDFLNKQAQKLSTWQTSPLWSDVDGPYKLKSFNTTSSAYQLVPNPNYGGSPKASLTLNYETFTSSTAEFDALKSGTLDIGSLDPTQLSQAPTLKRMGYSIFGGPSWGWFGGIINFKDTTNDFNHVIAQQYVRGVIQSLINEPAIIKAVYKGAAVASYGPTPSAPLSPYTSTSSTQPTYPFNPAAAAKVLKAHGWNVKPGGTTTCAKAGTAANECGAGIPVGTPISFTWANLPQSTSTTGIGESTILASEAKQVAGINIQLASKTFNFLTSNYNDQNPAASKYTNDWGVNNYGGLFMNYYPSQSGVWNPGGGFNLGDFNDPTVNSAIDAAVHSVNAKAVEAENNAEAKALPVFFFPDSDTLAAVSKRVGGPASSFTILTQQASQPQYWYIKK